MKKLFLFTTFLSLLSLTACNSRNTSSTAPSSPEKESSISVSEEEESTLEEESSNSQMYGYSVTVLKPDQSPCQGVSVVWCTSQSESLSGCQCSLVHKSKLLPSCRCQYSGQGYFFF